MWDEQNWLISTGNRINWMPCKWKYLRILYHDGLYQKSRFCHNSSRSPWWFDALNLLSRCSPPQSCRSKSLHRRFTSLLVSSECTSFLLVPCTAGDIFDCIGLQCNANLETDKNTVLIVAPFEADMYIGDLCDERDHNMQSRIAHCFKKSTPAIVNTNVALLDLNWQLINRIRNCNKIQRKHHIYLMYTKEDAYSTEE